MNTHCPNCNEPVAYTQPRVCSTMYERVALDKPGTLSVWFREQKIFHTCPEVQS